MDAQPQTVTRLSPWWRQSCVLVMVLGFSVLIWLAVRTYQTDAAAFVAQQRFGSPVDVLAPRQADAVRSEARSLLKENRFDPASRTLRFSEAEEASYRKQVDSWARYFSEPARNGGLPPVARTGDSLAAARTFVIGDPDPGQRLLLDTYDQMKEATRRMLSPGVTVFQLDAKGREICEANGLAEFHIDGISHGIGLRFEETPASTIIKPHRNVPLQEGMTVTIGHTVLARPGFGGVRQEDVYLVGRDGGEPLVPYGVEPLMSGPARNLR